MGFSHQGDEKLRAGTRGHGAEFQGTAGLFGEQLVRWAQTVLPSCFLASTRSIVPVEGSEAQAVTAVQPGLCDPHGSAHHTALGKASYTCLLFLPAPCSCE